MTILPTLPLMRELLETSERDQDDTVACNRQNTVDERCMGRRQG